MRDSEAVAALEEFGGVAVAAQAVEGAGGEEDARGAGADGGGADYAVDDGGDDGDSAADEGDYEGGLGGGSGGDVPAPTGTPSKPTHGNGPPVSFSTRPSASRAPFGNPSPSGSTTLAIPTLTGRPGAVPTHSPSSNGNIVTVTDIVKVTVTAPAVTVTAPAITAPAATVSTSSVFTPGVARSIRYRNGAKFRSLSAV